MRRPQTARSLVTGDIKRYPDDGITIDLAPLYGDKRLPFGWKFTISMDEAQRLYEELGQALHVSRDSGATNG